MQLLLQSRNNLKTRQNQQNAGNFIFCDQLKIWKTVISQLEAFYDVFLARNPLKIKKMQPLNVCHKVQSHPDIIQHILLSNAKSLKIQLLTCRGKFLPMG